MNKNLRIITLGIEIIKLSQIVSYTPVGQIKGSEGQSMTSALLLYLVMAQLRAESRVGSKKTPGGFLLMDNPLGKVTKPQLLKAQVELAKELGFQLIYATAIKDFSALNLFAHFVPLRHVSHDKANERLHVGVEHRLEAVEYTTYA